MFTGIDKKTGLITECKAKDKDTCPYHKPGTHNDERSKKDIMSYNENIFNENNEHMQSLSKKTEHKNKNAADGIKNTINADFTKRVAIGDYDLADGSRPDSLELEVLDDDSVYRATVRYSANVSSADAEHIQKSVLNTSIGSTLNNDYGITMSASHVESNDGGVVIVTGRIHKVTDAERNSGKIVDVAKSTGVPTSTVQSLSRMIKTSYHGPFMGDTYDIGFKYKGVPIKISESMKRQTLRKAAESLVNVEKARTNSAED